MCTREGSFSCLWLLRHGMRRSSSASNSRLAQRMQKKNTALYWKISTRLLLRSSMNARLIPMKNRITYTIQLSSRLISTSSGRWRKGMR